MARGEQNEFIPYYIICAEKKPLIGKNSKLSMKINNIAAKEPLGRFLFPALVASADLPGVYEQRRELNYSVLFFVIPERFERSTHALEGRCSIQLSYGTNLM